MLGDDASEHRQAPVDDRVNVFRIAVLGERGEPDEIGEQHRGVAPLGLRSVRADR